MEYYIISEDVIQAFATVVQKHCGLSKPIKISYIPQLLADHKSNYENFNEGYLEGGAINVKTFSSLKSLRPYAFYGYNKSITGEFTEVTSIGSYAFYGCTGSLAVDFPKAIYIGECAFQNCISFSAIKLPAIQTIGQSAFAGCTSLSAIYVLAETVPSLAASNAFTGTPIESLAGSIYVRSSMVSAFKAASVWSIFASQIKATKV